MKITMISHACLLIELAGKHVLTDPWMTEPIYWGFMFHRFGLGMRIEELPPLDLIVASHGHDDHLDPQTLRQLDRDTPVAVLDRAADKVRKLCFTNVHPMRAGERLELDELVVHGCHGKHPGGQVTYLLEGPEGKVYFAGDTAQDDRLRRLGDEHGPIDVALLPISGGRMLGERIQLHMNPQQSARLAKAIGAKVVIPTHYHFDLRKLPAWLTQSMNVAGQAGAFADCAAELCPESEVVELDVGETFSLSEAAQS